MRTGSRKPNNAPVPLRLSRAARAGALAFASRLLFFLLAAISDYVHPDYDASAALTRATPCTDGAPRAPHWHLPAASALRDVMAGGHHAEDVAAGSLHAAATGGSRLATDVTPGSEPAAAGEGDPSGGRMSVESVRGGGAAAGNAAQTAVVWDTVFFDRIALCGYEYEHFAAFLPGLPAVMAAGAALGVQPVVVALAVSWLAFAAAAAVLYLLSEDVTESSGKAAAAVLFLCTSPATVFMVYGYTEALFLLATFLGIWACVRARSPVLAAVPFAAGCLIRANGVVNAGFLIFHAVRDIRTAVSSACSQVNMKRRGLLAAEALMRGVELVASLLLMHWSLTKALSAGFETFCVRGDAQRPYCTALQGPSAMYSFVQAQYWGVGLFRYYQLKQIPNFLLAGPTAALAAACVVAYCKQHRATVLCLGGILPAAPLRRPRQRGSQHEGRSVGSPVLEGDTFVYVAHLAAMLGIALSVMHVQVTTRFLTSSPALYWFSADLLQWKVAWVGRLVLVYCVLWAWWGLVLFPNFYPWT